MNNDITPETVERIFKAGIEAHENSKRLSIRDEKSTQAGVAMILFFVLGAGSIMVGELYMKTEILYVGFGFQFLTFIAMIAYCLRMVSNGEKLVEMRKRYMQEAIRQTTDAEY